MAPSQSCGGVMLDDDVIKEPLMAMAIRHQAARLFAIWSLFQDGRLDAVSARYFLARMPMINCCLCDHGKRH
jgi:hypothetical protein